MNLVQKFRDVLWWLVNRQNADVRAQEVGHVYYVNASPYIMQF
jgi:hypothetical protein